MVFQEQNDFQMSPEEQLLKQCTRRCSSRDQQIEIVTGTLGAEENAHQIARIRPRWSLKLHQTVQHHYFDLDYTGY